MTSTGKAKRGEGMFIEHTMPSTQSEPEDVTKLRHMASEFTEGFNTGDADRNPYPEHHHAEGLSAMSATHR